MSNLELSSCNEKVNQNMRRLKKKNSPSSFVTQGSRLGFASSMLYLLWEAALSMNASPRHSHVCAHVTFISTSTLTPTWESRELVIVCYSHQWCACSSLCCVVTQSCPLCNPMDCSPPGSSVHGVSQARIPEWVAISSCRGSSDPETEPMSPASPALAGGFLPLSHRGNSEVKVYVDKYLRWICNSSLFQRYICVKLHYTLTVNTSLKRWNVEAGMRPPPQPSSYLLLRLIHERDLQTDFFFFLLYSRSFLAIYFIFLTFYFILAIAD